MLIGDIAGYTRFMRRQRLSAHLASRPQRR
jgi:hypothetical protein